MTTPVPATRRERRAARQAAAGRILSPAFRRWAYGVAAAALAAAIGIGWLPATATAWLVPLLGALFFVNDAGEPR